MGQPGHNLTSTSQIAKCCPTQPLRNPLARRLQSSQNNRDEPADGSLRRKASGCCQGMEAVARELVGADIVPKVAGLCTLGHELSDHGAKLLLRSNKLLVPMQKRRQLPVVVPMGLVGDERIGLQHCFESLDSALSLVSNLGEILEMARDLPFVPCC